MQALESDFYEPSPLLRELQVLSILARDPEVSQKEIASEVGLAPSMIHNYIHTLANAGLVEFHGPTRRRLRYVVTHHGRRRIEALEARHLAEAALMISRMTARIREEVERAAGDGVRSVGIVAAPALAETLRRVAEESGLRVQSLMPQGPSKSAAAAPMPPEEIDAVLVAEDQSREEVLEAVRRCRERGLRVYSLS